LRTAAQLQVRGSTSKSADIKELRTALHTAGHIHTPPLCPLVHLNTLIAPDSGCQLTNAFNINDRGEILAKAAPVGFTPNDDEDLGHLVLLIPCQKEDDACANTADPAPAIQSKPPAQIKSAFSENPAPHLSSVQGNVAA
jgi:hypothetical protein